MQVGFSVATPSVRRMLIVPVSVRVAPLGPESTLGVNDYGEPPSTRPARTAQSTI